MKETVREILPRLKKERTIKIGARTELATNNLKLIISCTVTALLLLLVFCGTRQFFLDGVPCSAALYVGCILGSVLTGAILAFQFSLPTQAEKWLSRIAMLALPVAALTLAECLNGAYTGNWLLLLWGFNCVLYAILYMLIYALTGQRRIPFLVINIILYAIALANHYVMAYRGTPFLPNDLRYLSTAATVAGAYEFTVDYQVIVSTVMLILTLAIAWKIKTPNQKLWKKIYYRTLAGTLAAFALMGYYTTEVAMEMGLKPYFFNQARSARIYGVSLNFFMNTRYMVAEKPKGYDPNEVENIMYELITDDAADREQKNPNVIIIMNESLSDLSVLGDITTNQDYMPFLHNLTENTIKGNLYVPVIGGGTSNTEYEFLTGASTAFLPSGSNAFTLYVDHELNGITKIFASNGYETNALHPYNKGNWNRINAYNHLGFHNYIALEDMFDATIISSISTATTSDQVDAIAEQHWLGKKVVLRCYVSDSYNYETLIQMYEGKPTDTPFYMFNVTMQNHSQYGRPYASFPQQIYLTDDKGQMCEEYPKTNQYLSLVYESDKAFEALVNYFAEQNEPTIICMFGDHQPVLENEFLQEVIGAETLYNLSIEQEQARYCTPFVIWANYDIEEREIDKLSVNYLSSYLMEVIGMEMPAFNRYLLKLSETLPVIDTIGYIDNQDKYYTYADSSPYADIIAGYEKICYNFLLDEDACCHWLYQSPK